MGLGDLVQGQDRKHCLRVPCEGEVCCDISAPSALLTWVSGQPLGECVRIQFLPPASKYLLTGYYRLSRSWLVPPHDAFSFDFPQTYFTLPVLAVWVVPMS